MFSWHHFSASVCVLDVKSSIFNTFAPFETIIVNLSLLVKFVSFVAIFSNSYFIIFPVSISLECSSLIVTLLKSFSSFHALISDAVAESFSGTNIFSLGFFPLLTIIFILLFLNIFVPSFIDCEITILSVILVSYCSSSII